MGGGEDIAGSVAQWTLASLAPDVSMYVSMLYPSSIIHQNQGQARTGADPVDSSILLCILATLVVSMHTAVFFILDYYY